MRILCGDIVISDLRTVNKNARAAEYYKLINIADAAERNGVNAPMLRQAAEKMIGEITPFVEVAAPTVPDVVTSLIEGVQQVIDGFGDTNSEITTKLIFFVKMMKQQQTHMFDAINAGVAPQQIILRTTKFRSRFVECKQYNSTIVQSLLEQFETASPLTSLVAYFVLRDFASSFATETIEGVPVFGFRNKIEVLKDDAREVFYVRMDESGVFTELVGQQNRASYSRQLKRDAAMKNILNKLVSNFCLDAIRANEAKIRKLYSTRFERKEKLSVVVKKLREYFEYKIFTTVSEGFNRLNKINRQWLYSATSSGSKNLFLAESPLNRILENIFSNSISHSKTVQRIRGDFIQNLKVAVEFDPSARAILLPPGGQVTSANMAQDTADALVQSMSLEFGEASEQGLRNVREYYLDVRGDFKITEDPVGNFSEAIPVIQIQRGMSGSIIVGLNIAARRLGFAANLFLTNVEKVDTNEIDAFLQTESSGTEDVTRFTVVAMSRPTQTLEALQQELEEEALDDNTPMLDENFFKIIN